MGGKTTPTKETPGQKSAQITKSTVTAAITAATTMSNTFTHQTTIFSSLFVALLILTLVTLTNTGMFDFPSGPKFEIHSISVAPFIITEGRIRSETDLNISFTVTNPNHDRDMIYDNLVLSVLYKKELVLAGILKPFHGEAGEKKSVEESVGASPGYVNNWVVVSALASPRAVNFSVRIDGRVKYGPGTSLEKIRGVAVSCENVRFGSLLLDLEEADNEPASSKCRVQVVKAM